MEPTDDGTQSPQRHTVCVQKQYRATLRFLNCAKKIYCTLQQQQQEEPPARLAGSPLWCCLCQIQTLPSKCYFRNYYSSQTFAVSETLAPARLPPNNQKHLNHLQPSFLMPRLELQLVVLTLTACLNLSRGCHVIGWQDICFTLQLNMTPIKQPLSVI